MSDDALHIGPGRERPPFQPRTLSCPNCGAPQRIRDDRAVRGICSSCDSRLDLTATEARLLEGKDTHGIDFDLAPGHPVTLDGHTWEVAARIAYRYVGDDPGDPLLHVYLLYSPRRSSRYLSVYDGSWEISEPTFVAPRPFRHRGDDTLHTHDGRSWTIQEKGSREVVHVDGALPFVVERGDRIDYIVASARDGSGERYELEIDDATGEVSYGITTDIPRGRLGAVLGAGVGSSGLGDDESLAEFIAERQRFKLGPALVLGGLGVGVLFLICFGVWSAIGMSPTTRHRVERALAKGPVLVAEAEQCLARLETLVSQEEAYMGSVDEVRRAIHDAERTRDTLVQLNGNVRRHIRKMDDWIVSTTDEHQMERDAIALAGWSVPCAEHEQRLQRVLSYKTDFEGWRGRADTVQAALEKRDSPTWHEGHAAVVQRYPDLAEPVQAMQATLVEQRDALHDPLEIAAAAVATDDIDYYAFGTSITSAEAGLAKLVEVEKAQAKVLARVDAREDQLLADCKRDYRAPVQSRFQVFTDRDSTMTAWLDEPGQEISSRRKNVGMVVWHKPVGALPSMADTHPTPPGWHYVGDDRFGAWTITGGKEAWAFNEEHAYMKDLYWGPGLYVAPTRSQYQTFLTRKQAGQVYYGEGTTPTYGREGSWTKKRFPQAVAILALARAASRASSRSSGSSRSSSSRSSSSSSSRSYGRSGK